MKRHNPQSSIGVTRLKHFTDFSQHQRESDSHVDECQLLALCSCEASRKWGTLGYVRPSTFPYPNNNYPQFTLCPRGTRSKQSKNITTYHIRAKMWFHIRRLPHGMEDKSFSICMRTTVPPSARQKVNFVHCCLQGSFLWILFMADHDLE